MVRRKSKQNHVPTQAEVLKHNFMHALNDKFRLRNEVYALKSTRDDIFYKIIELEAPYRPAPPPSLHPTTAASHKADTKSSPKGALFDPSTSGHKSHKKVSLDVDSSADDEKEQQLTFPTTEDDVFVGTKVQQTPRKPIVDISSDIEEVPRQEDRAIQPKQPTGFKDDEDKEEEANRVDDKIPSAQVAQVAQVLPEKSKKGTENGNDATTPQVLETSQENYSKRQKKEDRIDDFVPQIIKSVDEPRVDSLSGSSDDGSELDENSENERQGDEGDDENDENDEEDNDEEQVEFEEYDEIPEEKQKLIDEFHRLKEVLNFRTQVAAVIVTFLFILGVVKNIVYLIVYPLLGGDIFLRIGHKYFKNPIDEVSDLFECPCDETVEDLRVPLEYTEYSSCGKDDGGGSPECNSDSECNTT